MTYNFDEIVERRGTDSVKWDMAVDHKPADRDGYIPMWIADMDFACAPEIVSAIKKKADERIFGYSTTPADYRRKVVDFYERRHGFRAEEEEIVFTEGVVSALQYVIKALTKPGDKVIIQPPVYPPFFSSVESNGRELLKNDLIRHEDNSYDIDWEDLEEKASDEKARILLICSPHNPVGRIWTEEELRRLYDVCVRHDLVFLCDEIHNDLIRAGNAHVSARKLFPGDDRVIVCTAPTKTFNLAGLGASHMFCPCREAREKILALTGRQEPNPFTAAAVMAAYTECDEWLDQANAYMDRNFALFYDLCAKYFPLAVPAKTQGTYLAWLDVRKYVGENTAELEKTLYENCNVYVEAGDGFSGKGFLRINLACPAAYIEEAFRNIYCWFASKPVGPLDLNPTLAAHFDRAKADPSLKEGFLDRMTAVGMSILDRTKGNVELPEDTVEKIAEYLNERFDSSDTYHGFSCFYRLKLTGEILTAALEKAKAGKLR